MSGRKKTKCGQCIYCTHKRSDKLKCMNSINQGLGDSEYSDKVLHQTSSKRKAASDANESPPNIIEEKSCM